MQLHTPEAAGGRRDQQPAAVEGFESFEDFNCKWHGIYGYLEETRIVRKRSPSFSARNPPLLLALLPTPSASTAQVPSFAERSLSSCTLAAKAAAKAALRS